MKTSKYQKRFYRNWVYPKSWYKEEVMVKETDLQILTDKPLDKDFAIKRVKFYRDKIEDYINYKDRRFLTSLKPISVELTSHKIIQEMSRQAKKANVGPMATVAGAIAQFLGRDLLRCGYRQVIIENGGDIFLKVTKPIKVGLYSGRKKILNRLSLKIDPKDTPLGICTSSGTLGHSLSFGCADSVAILSKNAALADAVATATANLVQKKGDLERAINFARSVKGILGAAIILKNNLASWGKIKFV
jgi:ApbE superfamily uncharacterized protein (UPF0280 family)